jgi:hypothetical protein
MSYAPSNIELFRGAASYVDKILKGAKPSVGTRVSSRAPRTEPYLRLSRIRLPPRVCDGKANTRPRMEDDRFREPSVRELCHPCPRHPILQTDQPDIGPFWHEREDSSRPPSAVSEQLPNSPD